MDYETGPLNRTTIRNISKVVRKAFGCKSDDEPFPTIKALEILPDILPNSSYEVVEDKELPARVFACCYPKSDGGYTILIKRTVYDGAVYDMNPAFICFIEKPPFFAHIVEYTRCS